MHSRLPSGGCGRRRVVFQNMRSEMGKKMPARWCAPGGDWGLQNIHSVSGEKKIS
jgi:hypothetical protein